MEGIELRTIKNTSTVPQPIVHDGEQFVLGPGEEQQFDAVIANKFLEMCAPVVVDTTDKFGSVFVDKEEVKKTIWVANMTGNPDAPEKITIRRLGEKSHRMETIEIENPNKTPRDVKRTMECGQTQYTAKDKGLVQLTNAPKEIELPRFRRRELPRDEGEWFVQRDSVSGEYAGAVLESRPPSDFEPEMSWKLNDMRLYLQLIDPSAERGPDEAKLAQQVAEKKATDKEAAQMLKDAKQLLMKRIYFRVANPAYRLPSRKEFNELQSGVSEADVSKEELDQLLKVADHQTRKGAGILKQATPSK